MTFPVLGGNGAVAVGEANSLRFNDDDSAYLTRTPSSAGNRKTWTWSGWVKRSSLGLGVSGAHQYLFSSGADSSNNGRIYLRSDDRLQIYSISSGATQMAIVFDPIKFRDVSAWYHFLIVVDTTDATETDRVQLYVNGTRHTQVSSTGGEGDFPSQNSDNAFNTTDGHSIGRRQHDNAYYFDGYMAEVHFIDGTAKSPTDFGEFDSTSGIWKVKDYSGSYGTNGFKLNFSDSGSLGADSSGNGNNFTPTNLASTDQTTDTPTNNFATFNALFKRTSVNPTFSEGNLKVVQTTSNGIAYSTQGVYSGKWYAEIKVDNVGTATSCGILEPSAYDNGNPDTQAIYYQSNGNKNNKGSASSYGASYTTGDIIGIALDADNGTLAFYKNGASQGTAFTGLDTNTTWLIGCHGYGVSGSQSGNYGNPPFAISSGNSDDNGYGNFEYTPPSGFLALCTQNLATELSPTIDDGSDYFNPVLFTGNGANDHAITGVGFQPDWVWLKGRNSADGNNLWDINRGVNNRLFTHNANAELADTNSLKSFDSDGFTMDNDTGINGSGDTYVTWNWLASNTTASNTDGSITSTVSVNQTAGFSIVTYTGTGANATVGHGLGVAPKVVIIKNRDSAASWMTYHEGVDASNPADFYLFLNSTGARVDDATAFQDTKPTSTVFSIGNGSTQNQSGANIIAYCFAPITGYSAMGKYTGVGTDFDGAFAYLGFKPSFLMVKNATNSGEWGMFDSARNTFNVVNARVSANSDGAEYSGDANRDFDFLSNGFKVRNGSADVFNTSGDTFIYMCFAENPFVDSNGIPVTAR